MLFLASPVNVGDGNGIKGKKNAGRRYRGVILKKRLREGL